MQELIRGDRESKDRFAQLKVAYDVLSDSSSRSEYDQQLGLVTKGSAPAVKSHVGLVTVSGIVWQTIFTHHNVEKLSPS